MANRVKSFMPAPTYELNPPPKGPIGLGTILSDKNKPKRPLNRKAVVEIDAEDKFTHQQRDVEVTSSQIRERSGGVWTAFLANVGLPVGVDVSTEFKSGQEYVIACDKIDTDWFQPDYKYIFDSLQTEDVKAYGKSIFWTRSVYMVTGVKIARGVKMKSLEQSKWAVKAAAKGDGTGAGTPVSGGVKGAVGGESVQRMKWGESDDFVFAYSLIKIKRKRDGTFTEHDVEKGNLFDTDEVKKEEEKAEKLADNWDMDSVKDEGMFEEELIPDE
jgi:hypothetical protein